MTFLVSLAGVFTLCFVAVSAWTVPSKQGPNFGIINCDHVDSSVKRFCLEQIQKRGMYQTRPDDNSSPWMDAIIRGRLPGSVERNDHVYDARDPSWNKDFGDAYPSYGMSPWQYLRPAAQDSIRESDLMSVLEALHKREAALRDIAMSDSYSRYKRSTDSKERD